MAKHGPTIWWASILLTACVSAAHAATSITATFIPSPPLYEQPLTVRLADSQGAHCWPAATSITQTGLVITLSLRFSDYCNSANVVAYRDYLLGSFPAGNYVFVYESCSNNPPPLPSTCNTVLQQPFSVAAPPPVPALSRWATLALIVATILAAVRFRRRPRAS